MRLSCLEYGKGFEFNVGFSKAGIFVSVGKYWQGVYFRTPWKTIRVYLFGVDWH